MHPFTPDPDFPGDCARCPLPAAHASHQAAGPPPEVRHLRSPHVSGQHTGSATSHAAAGRASLRAGTARADVLRMVADADPHRGVTDAEIAEALAATYSANTPRPRRVELLNAGLIEQATGEDGAPVLRGGFAAWTATPAGRRALAAAA